MLRESEPPASEPQTDPWDLPHRVTPLAERSKEDLIHLVEEMIEERQAASSHTEKLFEHLPTILEVRQSQIVILGCSGCDWKSHLNPHAGGISQQWKSHLESLAGFESQDSLWRKLLWLNHSRYIPGTHMPYGDDGEMQCCGVDFKRWSVREIERFLTERALIYLDAEKKRSQGG